MAHLAENSIQLTIHEIAVKTEDDLLLQSDGFADVCVLRLPSLGSASANHVLAGVEQLATRVAKNVAPNSTLIVIGETIDLVHAHTALADVMRYHLWIAVKRETVVEGDTQTALPQQHFGALVYTNKTGQLQHAKTRIQYTYCPTCNKTTKDYGGKKHTYHEYGTLMSDIWWDVACNPDGDITPIIDRFADLFGIEPYRELRLFDLRLLPLSREPVVPQQVVDSGKNHSPEANVLLNGDCLEELRKLPDNSVDFAFADPPYNLKKNYAGYSDDLTIAQYFAWCDEWITELARVLRPGRTCAILNIPLWAIRHFLHMEKILEFQNWIVWDALSFPVRLIMPAHYAILCFTKGHPRPLPGLTGEAGQTETPFSSKSFQSLAPLAEGYCLRSQCIAKRKALHINDRSLLTDLWGDIHRLKHNSRRVDHPCQLPPQLMYRLISIYTKPGEVVLDCFNGAGTTTLCAHQLERGYIGIEASEKYYKIALSRHEEINYGMDPFRKEDRVLTAKNSPVARLQKQKYEVPKKTLQLEVKRIATLLDRLPTREEVIEFSSYPIRYYDEYFSSWGEVCAAARTTGMKETREEEPENSYSSQPRLF